MVFGSRWLDASERRPFSPHGPFPRQQRRSGSHVQGLVRERPECHADVEGAGTEFSIAHDLSLRGQQNCRSVGLSCGMTKWLGKKGEPQVPPLRCAPVGGCDFLISFRVWWPESSEEHGPTNVLEVLRLRAGDPLLSDRS